jgi:hypothetical protein
MRQVAEIFFLLFIHRVYSIDGVDLKVMNLLDCSEQHFFTLNELKFNELQTNSS